MGKACWGTDTEQSCGSFFGRKISKPSPCLVIYRGNACPLSTLAAENQRDTMEDLLVCQQNRRQMMRREGGVMGEKEGKALTCAELSFPPSAQYGANS